MDCQTCGEKFFSPDDGDNLENHKTIYTLLTTIEMSQFTLDDVLKVCMRCSARLTEIEDFRLVCLSVYQKLHGVKIEPIDDGFHREIVCVELKTELLDNIKASIDENTDSFEDGKELKSDNDDNDADALDGPDASDDSTDDNDDGDSDYKETSEKEDEKEPEVDIKPKKPRAKWGSKKKIKPSEPRKVFPCDECNKVCLKEHRLVAHKRTHRGLKPFYCEACDKGFQTLRNIKKHNKLLHSADRVLFPCKHPGCSEIFRTEKGCQKHFSETHDPNYVPEPTETFVCDICGKSYTSKGSLKIHSYTHDRDSMPFKCTVCGKGFPLGNKLKEHMMRHKGIRNFTCPHCGLQKVTRNELNGHIRLVHKREFRRQCDLCSNEFNSAEGMKIHVRTVHQGLKPFECNVCGSRFGKKDHLNRHMKRHIRDGLVSAQ
ncbi:gastrula zinc finger protein XlCGF26.1-like isoform X2 [Uranotaenia lowii]|uniref:gastrula zinc finger protein XlCGF26.1-like isoform X2 n=1 Tax=Uranotaenia lowii TaxID=190385 RepID=UPI0024799299|nr:gastrula zinc finger protein XlCGF26.1-like isoform X2 [Uranotaenia lowii]